jgi:hypothetical protein
MEMMNESSKNTKERLTTIKNREKAREEVKEIDRDSVQV